jgi:hypothetical protein
MDGLEECICPECPSCGAHGDPDCYVDSKTTKDAGHWLTRSPEQIAQHLRLWEEWKKRNEADEARYAIEAQAAALAEPLDYYDMKFPHDPDL